MSPGNVQAREELKILDEGDESIGFLSGIRSWDAEEFVELWETRYLDSADFLGLLYGRLYDGEDQPGDEWVYYIATACRKYHEFVTDLHKSGAAFRLPEPGSVFYPATAISRLGLLPLVYECDCCDSPCVWDGDDSRLNGDAETQVRPAHTAASPAPSTAHTAASRIASTVAPPSAPPYS